MMTPAAWAGLAIAGGLGAAARFTVDTRVNAVVARRRRARTGPRRPRWSDAIPLGTIAVNLTACLLLGLLAGLAAAPSWPSWIDAVVGTGFLGGYSTFSTASLEGARHDGGRPGHGVDRRGSRIRVGANRLTAKKPTALSVILGSASV